MSPQNNALIHWLDIKTEGGFVREFNKNKYYYDKNNTIINVESTYSYPSFPPVEINFNNLDHKLGTIDF